MSNSSSYWMNIACLVCGVILGLAGERITRPAQSDAAELQAQLALVARRLSEIDARLAARPAAQAIGVDARQIREIVRSALDERYGRSQVSAAPEDVGSMPLAPDVGSARPLSPQDENRLRAVIDRGDPQEMISAVREVMRSLDP